jgi:CHAD domain-containing protein
MHKTKTRATNLYDPFRKRLEAFEKELRDVGKSDVGAIHRVRVASRRLRELLPLLELPRDATRGLARRLRKVTKQLGKVRELDVQTELIKELRESKQSSAAALQQLGTTIAQARVAASERLSEKLPVAKLERLAGKFGRLAKDVESDDSKSRRKTARNPTPRSLWVLDARVARRASAVRTKVEASGAVYAPEQLHGVRLAVKKLRYAAELVAEVTDRRVATDIATLKAAQDLLGRLHDLETLLVRAREAQPSARLPHLITGRETRSVVRVLEDQCRQLHARYLRERPELMAIANRMGAREPESEPASYRAAG